MARNISHKRVNCEAEGKKIITYVFTWLLVSNLTHSLRANNWALLLLFCHILFLTSRDVVSVWPQYFFFFFEFTFVMPSFSNVRWSDNDKYTNIFEFFFSCCCNIHIIIICHFTFHSKSITFSFSLSSPSIA